MACATPQTVNYKMYILMNQNPIKMMKIIPKTSTLISAFIILVSANIVGYSQPDIEWEKSLGGTGSDKGMSISQTSDNGYILAGYSTSINGDITANIGEKYWVAKLEWNGSLLWEKSYTKGNGADSLNCTIIQTNDGGYILTAASSNSTLPTDFWIVKLDMNGSIIWDKEYGGSSFEKPFSIHQTSDNGYIVAGYASSLDGDVGFNHYSTDCWVMKLNSFGNIVWKKVLGGFGDEKFHSIIQTTDGGYIAVGNTNSVTGNGDISFNHGGGDLWVVKFDGQGNTTWEKCYGGSNGEGFWMEKLQIIQTMDGGYAFVGNTSSTNGDISLNDGGNDAWVVKINASGQIEWEKTFGGSMVDYLNSIVQISGGDFIVGGHTFSTDGDISSNNGWFDFWLLRLNNSGAIVWEQNYGGSSYEELYELEKTSDGGLMLIGSTRSSDGDVSNNNGGFEDIWVVKLNNMLNVTENYLNQSISVNNPISDKIILNASTNIEKAEIKVYDMTGAVLFTETTSISKQHSLDISLQSGAYILEIKWEKYDQIFKIIRL